MNPGRLPDESQGALQLLMVSLREVLQAERDRPLQDNICDIHECFGGPMPEPVLPLEPPRRVDPWTLITHVLSQTDFEYVVRGLGMFAAWRFRRQQVRIHSMYATTICLQLRKEHSQIVEASRLADNWDIQYLKQRAFRRETGILRLRFAGVVFLANMQLGERLSRSAIESMRLEFSLAPSAA